MTLIKESVTRYRCTHCGYQSEREPLSGKCPACSDGESKIYSLDRITGHDTHEWVPPGS